MISINKPDASNWKEQNYQLENVSRNLDDEQNKGRRNWRLLVSPWRQKKRSKTWRALDRWSQNETSCWPPEPCILQWWVIHTIIWKYRVGNFQSRYHFLHFYEIFRWYTWHVKLVKFVNISLIFYASCIFEGKFQFMFHNLNERGAVVKIKLCSLAMCGQWQDKHT